VALAWLPAAEAETLVPVAPPTSPMESGALRSPCFGAVGASEAAAGSPGKCPAKGSVLLQADTHFLRSGGLVEEMDGAAAGSPRRPDVDSVEDVEAGEAGSVGSAGDTDATAFCGTRVDGTASDLNIAGSVGIAPPGTECLFGVDPRDEGRHCIMDSQYGALGWCFTREDKSQWGSCNDGCPLAGVDGVLETKVDAVTERLKEVSERFEGLKCCGKNTSDGEEKKGGGKDKKAGKKAPDSGKKTAPKNGKKKGKKAGLLSRLMKTAPSKLPIWTHARRP